MADRYEGLEEFLAERGRALLRSAYLLTADHDLAQDVLQEALVRVAPRWRRLRAREAAEAYVRRTMYGLVVDGWRAKGRRPVETSSAVLPEGVTGRDVGSDVADRVTLDTALDRLTPRQRQVLVLRFYEDLTEVQTADVMRCSVSTVKSQTKHALMRLRELAPELAAFSDEDSDEGVHA
jgi:RNA polymerase sigma-70 factor (sigma-E family)